MRTLTLVAFTLSTLLSCGNGSKATDQGSDPAISDSLLEAEQVEATWELVPVVDEFGDEVAGESAIVGIFDGEMSNSATANAQITVKAQVADSALFLTIYEYGNTPASLPDETIFKIQIKKADGSTEFIEVFSFRGMLYDREGDLMERLLSQDEPLKVNIDMKRAKNYLNSVYNFQIDPEGLNELLQEN